MLMLIKLELFKIFSKWRTYIGFISIFVLIPLIHIALYFEGKKLIELGTQALSGGFNLSGNLLNGFMATRIILQSFYVHIPLLVALVAGDMLAGEATSGTYRFLLTKPVSRLQIISAKYISGVIYVASLLLVLMALSLGVGILIFGTGDMIIVNSNITILKEADSLWRFYYSFGYAFLSMLVVYSFAFMFSAFVENSIGPIMATMSLIIVFSILNILGGGVFVHIQPFLFTTHMQNWKGLFDNPIDYGEINTSVAIMIAHIVLLTTLTFVYFTRKDINS